MNILIVKTSSLGDIIHAFPAIAYLKKRFPDAKIDWIVEKPYSALVEAHPFVNRAIPVDTKKWRKAPFSSWADIQQFRRSLQATTYDVAFDLQGNLKSGLILSQAKARKKVGFGWATAPEKPNGFFTHVKFNPPSQLTVREENVFLVQSFFDDRAPFHDEPITLKLTPEEQIRLQSLPRSAVMVCPGSAWSNKQATPEALIQFLEKLLPCHFVFVWGNEQERREVDRLATHFPGSHVLERLSLPLLQNLMRQMDLIVAMDSLPLHLAGTAGVRTFGIFGPSSAAKYKPSGKLHLVHQGICPYQRTFSRRCPILRTCPTGLCTRGITGDELFHSFKNENLLNLKYE